MGQLLSESNSADAEPFCQFILAAMLPGIQKVGQEHFLNSFEEFSAGSGKIAAGTTSRRKGGVLADRARILSLVGAGEARMPSAAAEMRRRLREAEIEAG